MDKLMLKKQYMMYAPKKKGRLPSAYQEVEYIQGTGTQCINTGVTYSSTLKVDLDYSSQDITGDVDLFGIWVNSNTGFSVDTGWVVGFAGGNRIRSITGLGYNSNFSVSVPNIGGDAYFSDNQVYNLNTKYNLIFNLTNNVFKLIRDGVIQKIKSGGSFYYEIQLQTCLDMYKEVPMYLFSRMQTYGFSKTTVYRCKIEREGLLVRDFIPCYRKSDNEIGLYDIVNNQFYTNAGSSSFLKGANV